MVEQYSRNVLRTDISIISHFFNFFFTGLYIFSIFWTKMVELRVFFAFPK